MLPFLVFQFESTGYVTARRARMLWLRGGMNRQALFNLAEWQGLRASFISWGVVAGMTAAITPMRDSSPATEVLLYIGTQGAIGVVAFYAGAGVVKDWHIGDMPLFILLGLMFVVSIVVGRDSWQDGYTLAASGFTTLIAVVLVVLLRLLAVHRWRSLDWRVASH
jgi:hypothetical protein